MKLSEILPLNELSELDIDYLGPENNVARRDPYLIWADLTHRAGIVNTGENYSSGGVPMSKDIDAILSAHEIDEDATTPVIRVLVERKVADGVPCGTTASIKRCVDPLPLYNETDVFFTAELKWKPDGHNFCSALQCVGVEGIEGFDIGVQMPFGSVITPTARSIVARALAAGVRGAGASPLMELNDVLRRYKLDFKRDLKQDFTRDFKRDFKPGLGQDFKPGFKQEFGQADLKTLMLRKIDLGRKPTVAGWNFEPVFRPSQPVELPQKLGGKVVAIIDHGCAFANQSILDAAGVSRVKYLWDQDDRRTPAPVSNSSLQMRLSGVKASPWRTVITSKEASLYGGELRATDIQGLMARHTRDGIVDEAACYNDAQLDALRESSSHGTHIMSLAAGWPNPLKLSATMRDVAADADIIFVQLPRETIADTSGAGMNVFVLDALKYIIERTDETADVVVNLSYGTFAGPHDGSSRMERAIDSLIQQRTTRSRPPRQGSFRVVLPAGNAYNAACHARLELQRTATTKEVALSIDPDCRVDTFVELWYNAGAVVEVEVRPPGSAEWLAPVAENTVRAWREAGDVRKSPVLTVVHVGHASRDNNAMLIAINPSSALSRGSNLLRSSASASSDDRPLAPGGVWDLRVRSKSDDDVVVDAWIERDDLVMGTLRKGQQARFLAPLQQDDQLPYPSDEPVTKMATISSFASGYETIVVGGCVGDPNSSDSLSGTDDVYLSPYSSEGPRRRSLGGDRPDRLAIADESWARPGILAAGNVGIGVARRNGTSVAVPSVVRELINEPRTVGSQLDRPPPPRPPSDFRIRRRSLPA